MKGTIIDKGRDTTSGSLNVSRKSMEGTVIYDGNNICLLDVGGGAMVLGKLPVPGRPTIWMTVGQGPTGLAIGAGGGCLDIFTLI